MNAKMANSVTSSNRRQGGFSLLETMITVAMVLVLTTIAVPVVIATVADVNLKTTAMGLSGVLQRARMKAATENSTYTVRTTRLNGSTVVYVDLNNNGTLDTNEQKNLLSLPRRIVFDTGGPSLTLGGSQTLALPGFDPRGLPCTAGSSTCTASSGTSYYYFLKQDRTFTTPGWAAVTVSPAGRVKVYSWNGSTWQ